MSPWDRSFPLLTVAGDKSGLCCEVFSLEKKYPVYVSPERVAALKAEEASLGVMLTASSGGRLAYLPAVPAISEELLRLLETADVILFDGTFWSDDELIQVQGSGATAREMGHVPVSGEMAACACWLDCARPRKIFVHVNNTNPMLDESGPEYRELRAAGWEVSGGWVAIESVEAIFGFAAAFRRRNWKRGCAALARSDITISIRFTP